MEMGHISVLISSSDAGTSRDQCGIVKFELPHAQWRCMEDPWICHNWSLCCGENCERYSECVHIFWVAEKSTVSQFSPDQQTLSQQNEDAETFRDCAEDYCQLG